MRSELLGLVRRGSQEFWEVKTCRLEEMGQERKFLKARERMFPRQLSIYQLIRVRQEIFRAPNNLNRW